MHFNTLELFQCRLGGVYGPGEEMIMKRSIAFLETRISNLFVFEPNKELQTDFVHIRNVVQANIKVFKTGTKH